MSNKQNNAVPVEFGCHCDLEPGMSPDGCVIDEGRPENCVHARRFSSKEQCVYWKPITPPAAAPAPAVPQGLPAFDELDDEVIDAACTLGSLYRVDLMRAYECIRAMLSAAPAAPSQPVTLTDRQFDLICQAIDKADTITMEGDYMMDSDDCIGVVRVMQALFSIAALREKQAKATP